MATTIAETLIASCLPPRARTAYKGQFGRILIVGGGRGMPGAVRLCGEAALRSGAGLVSAATLPGHAAAIVSSRPELMCHETHDADSLQVLLEAADIVVLGPGLGRGAWAGAMFETTMGFNRQLIVDADGLNLLARRAGSSGFSPRERWVLTPHPGEAARLLDTDVAAVQADREGAAQALAARFGGIVVLKGAGTLVATGNQPLALCRHGNPGMATAGMGDVLSGIMAAMLAQIHSPWDAARVAVQAHALAGDRAARHGERGMIAGDAIAELRHILNP